MRINFILAVLALIIGGLISYGFFAVADSTLFALVGGIAITLFMVISFGVGIVDCPRGSVMFKTLAGFLSGTLIITNSIFIALNVPEPVFIITNGLISTLGIIGLYLIYKSQQ